MTLRFGAMTIALAVIVTFLSGHQEPAAATEGGEHGVTGRSAEHAHAGSPLPGQIWAEIDARRKVLEKLVWEADLDKIHAPAGDLPALGAKLLDASGDLEAAKRARVEDAVKQLPGVTDRLHDAAHGGDALETGAEFKKLANLLDLIAAQLPPEALSAPAAPPSHHEKPAAESAHAGHEHHAMREPVTIPENAQKMSVTAKDFRFDPPEIVVKRGIPVALTLVNRGMNEHAWVIEAKPEVHLHAMVKGTDTRVFTLEEPGEYPIKCTIPGHTELGMVGKVVVR